MSESLAPVPHPTEPQPWLNPEQEQRFIDYYYSYGQHLGESFRRWGMPEDICEDMAQDVMYRLIKQWPRLDDVPNSPRRLADVITVNRLRDHPKSTYHALVDQHDPCEIPTWHIDSGNSTRLDEQWPSPEEEFYGDSAAAVAKEWLKEIDRALSPTYRALFRQYLQHPDGDSLAAALGVSRKQNVGMRLLRMREQLFEAACAGHLTLPDYVTTLYDDNRMRPSQQLGMRRITRQDHD